MTRPVAGAPSGTRPQQPLHNQQQQQQQQQQQRAKPTFDHLSSLISPRPSYGSIDSEPSAYNNSNSNSNNNGNGSQVQHASLAAGIMSPPQIDDINSSTEDVSVSPHSQSSPSNDNHQENDIGSATSSKLRIKGSSSEALLDPKIAESLILRLQETEEQLQLAADLGLAAAKQNEELRVELAQTQSELAAERRLSHLASNVIQQQQQHQHQQHQHQQQQQQSNSLNSASNTTTPIRRLVSGSSLRHVSHGSDFVDDGLSIEGTAIDARMIQWEAAVRDDIRKDLGDAVAENQSLRSEMDLLQHDIAALRASLSANQPRIMRAAKRASELEDSLAAEREHLYSMQARVDKLEDTYNRSHSQTMTTVKDMQDDLGMILNAAAELRDGLAMVDSNNSRVDMRLAAVTARFENVFDELDTTIDLLKEQVAQTPMFYDTGDGIIVDRRIAHNSLYSLEHQLNGNDMQFASHNDIDTQVESLTERLSDLNLDGHLPELQRYRNLTLDQELELRPLEEIVTASPTIMSPTVSIAAPEEPSTTSLRPALGLQQTASPRPSTVQLARSVSTASVDSTPRILPTASIGKSVSQSSQTQPKPAHQRTASNSSSLSTSSAASSVRSAARSTTGPAPSTVPPKPRTKPPTQTPALNANPLLGANKMTFNTSLRKPPGFIGHLGLTAGAPQPASSRNRQPETPTRKPSGGSVLNRRSALHLRGSSSSLSTRPSIDRTSVGSAGSLSSVQSITSPADGDVSQIASSSEIASATARTSASVRSASGNHPESSPSSGKPILQGQRTLGFEPRPPHKAGVRYLKFVLDNDRSKTTTTKATTTSSTSSSSLSKTKPSSTTVTSTSKGNASSNKSLPAQSAAAKSAAMVAKAATAAVASDPKKKAQPIQLTQGNRPTPKR
ncbi:hypothetical protein GQ42DRAFT_9989 [Ramicandelaber brevisporus]|nr:hypothetical protein GQ42DRAFT_9989 [Ramicandelaber brevisporus]